MFWEIFQIRNLFIKKIKEGPKLGYNPNASKSWLVIKLTGEEKAREVFGGTSINNRTDGRSILVATLEMKVDSANTLRNW